MTSSHDDRLTFDDVILLLEVLDAAPGSVDLEIQTGKGRLAVQRSHPQVAAGLVGQETSHPAAPGDATTAPPAAVVPAPAATREPDGQDGHSVTAPLTGVFYRAPAPGEAPFVEAGTVVNADTVVGIIEVMKMMNTIAAGESGVVESIDVDDAQLVEHGQTLIRLKRS